MVTNNMIFSSGGCWMGWGWGAVAEVKSLSSIMGVYSLIPAMDLAKIDKIRTFLSFIGHINFQTRIAKTNQ